MLSYCDANASASASKHQPERGKRTISSSSCINLHIIFATGALLVPFSVAPALAHLPPPEYPYTSDYVHLVICDLFSSTRCFCRYDVLKAHDLRLILTWLVAHFSFTVHSGQEMILIIEYVTYTVARIIYFV
jgi:hypothetical protein